MTTQELHINLDLTFQKLNSHWNKNILPQEKDIIINTHINSYIKNRMIREGNMKGLGIYDTIKRIEDLKPLVKTVTLDVLYDEKGARVLLPFDYLYYIGSGVNLYKCREAIEQPLVVYERELDLLSADFLAQSGRIWLMYDDDSFLLFDVNSLPASYINSDVNYVYSPLYLLNNAFLIKAKEAVRELDRDYEDGSTIEIKIDSARKKIIYRGLRPFEVRYVTNNTNTYTPGNFTYKSKDIENSTNIKPLKAEVGIIDEEFRFGIENSYLSGTVNKNVRAVLGNKFIDLLVENESVIYKSVSLTYISKPTKVDLLLNSNSELSDTSLDEVINNTDRYLKGFLSVDAYEKTLNENMLLE